MNVSPSPFSTRAAALPSAARRELEQAVNIAVESFARCFNEMFPRIEDELFASAERETDRQKQSRILDAYGLVRANRGHIEQEFRRAIESIARERISPRTAQAVDFARQTLSADALSLVDEAEVESDIVVKRLVSRLRRADDAKLSELRDLDARMSYLLGREELGDGENPFSPDALARAVQKAFRELAAEQAVQAEILRTFETFAAEAFNPAYHELNSHFAGRQVLPDVAAHQRERMRAGRGESRTLPGAATLPGRATLPRGEYRPGVTSTVERVSGVGASETLLDKFSRFRATQPDAGAPRADAPPDTFWPVITRSVVDYLPTLVPNNANVAAARTGVVTVPLADLNLLHQVRDNARRFGAPRDEEILIDLVAVVVDKILQDKQVPERIKRLIARLQVPLLKAALLDKNLFATREHPARVLLDAIARSAVGWSEDNDTEGRYYQLVFEIVTTVESGFTDDVALFDEQTRKLEAFLAEEAEREARRYAQAAAMLQQVEQREVADVQALEQIRDAVADIELSEELTEFLLEQWRHVLVDATVSGASPAALTGYRTVLTDLVWSVQPKVTPDERKVLVRKLPDLLKRIRNGLLAIDCPPSVQEKFFTHLMQLHSAAVKVGVRSQMQDRAFATFESRVQEIRIDPDAPGEVPVQISPESLKASVQHGPVEVAVAGEPAEPPRQRLPRPARMTREYIDGMMAEMNKGVWVEFVRGASVKVARLRWVSPRKSMYLFTDRLGKEAITYTPELLRVQIADGLLALLDPKGLSERVIESLEESIGALV